VLCACTLSHVSCPVTNLYNCYAQSCCVMLTVFFASLLAYCPPPCGDDGDESYPPESCDITCPHDGLQYNGRCLFSGVYDRIGNCQPGMSHTLYKTVNFN